MVLSYKKTMIFVLVLVLGSLQEALSGYESMTFEQASTHGFNSPVLGHVMYLKPGRDGWLDETPTRRQALVKSQSLSNLCSLDLRCQRIDDDFVKALCNNPTFSRLSSLDLSDNPSITEQSLQYILASENVGSLREGMQMSGRYGKPSSEVRVRVTGTSISRAEAEKWHEKAHDNFRIEYRRIVDDKTLWSPVIGVKLLLIAREEREEDEVPTGPTGAALPFPYMVVPGPTGSVTYVSVPSWPGSTGPTGPAQPF